MSTNPYATIHEDGDDAPQEAGLPKQQTEQAQPSGPSQNQQADPALKIASGASNEEALRAQISAELQQQMAMERFQQEHPEMWLQVNRLGRLMGLQDECEGGIFPPGSCFLYANVPGYQAFAVKKVLGVDLDTCQASIDVHSDGELEEGTVMLPLETISWYGFPKDAVPLSFPYSGFSTSRPMS